MVETLQIHDIVMLVLTTAIRPAPDIIWHLNFSLHLF